MRHLPGMLLLLSVAVTFPAESVVQPASGAEQPALRQIVLTVRGMMCASCGREVEKSLKKVAGVVTVVVDVSGDRATVTYDERKVTPRQLAEAARKTGYEVLLPAEAPHPAPPAH